MEICAGITKLTPTCNVCLTFSQKFPPAKITMFTVTNVAKNPLENDFCASFFVNSFKC